MLINSGLELIKKVIKMKVLICVLLTIGATWAWNKHMEEANLYEGDIKLSYKQLLFGSIRGKRWTNNIVPYVIHSSLSVRWIRLIRNVTKKMPCQFLECFAVNNNAHIEHVINDAIGVYHKRTCLKFVKRTSQQNYIEFFKGSGCWSFVGMNGGKQQISLGPGCHYTATAQHEMGHAIGLHHEQTRPDRDSYVKIHLNNLNNQKYAGNFHLNRDINSLGTPYDFYSMMHYGSTAFAKSGTKTITTKDPSKQKLIDNNYHYGMSDIDAKQIKLMYNCNGDGGNGNNNGDLKNDGENCWSKCGGGACPQFCGRTGLCCRNGWNDAGCDKASNACHSYHCCTAPKKDVRNVGNDCWHHCSYKGGPCTSGYCGKDGLCCRKGWAGDQGCDNAKAACDNIHCCTA